MHHPPINDNLVRPNPVMHCICRIRRRGNLDLAPLAIRWHELALLSEALELFIHALLFDASFPLDKGGFYHTR